jgi:hypothetical protein
MVAATAVEVLAVVAGLPARRAARSSARSAGVGAA